MGCGLFTLFHYRLAIVDISPSTKQSLSQAHLSSPTPLQTPAPSSKPKETPYPTQAPRKVSATSTTTTTTTTSTSATDSGYTSASEKARSVISTISLQRTRKWKIKEMGTESETQVEGEGNEKKARQTQIQTQPSPQTPQKNGLLTPPKSPSSIRTSPPRNELSITTPMDIDISSISPSMTEMPSLIQDLAREIQSYKCLIQQTRNKTLSDLSSILSPLDPSRAKLKLEILRRDLDCVFGEKCVIYSTYFSPVLERLPWLWQEFLRLSFNERTKMAKELDGDRVLMRMFGLLSEVRTGCERQGELDKEVNRRVKELFDDVLGLLKNMQGMGGEGVMGWRVMEIVMGKRMGGVGALAGRVMERRLGVSGGLLGIVEELGEGI